MNRHPLLMDTRPLVVLPELAVCIGLNEAIVMQQVHYWLENNRENSRNFKEGRCWTYNSLPEWQKQFPFWSERTIRRIIENLIEHGLLIRKMLSEDQTDRTYWYTIDYDVYQAKIRGCIPSAESSDASGQNDHMDVDNLPTPSGQNDHMHPVNLSTSDLVNLSTSIDESKTPTKTSSETPTEREGADAPTPPPAVSVKMDVDTMIRLKKETGTSDYDDKVDRALESEFETVFWLCYPRKDGKPKSKQAFINERKNGATLQEIMDGLKWWKQSDQWREDGGKYIKWAQGWLNNQYYRHHGVDTSQLPQKGSFQQTMDMIGQFRDEMKSGKGLFG